MLEKVASDGNIVEQYKIGNATIKICDAAYRDKTPAEIDKILKNLTDTAWRCVQAARAQGKDI